jgi:hypothetical protein
MSQEYYSFGKRIVEIFATWTTLLEKIQTKFFFTRDETLSTFIKVCTTKLEEIKSIDETFCSRNDIIFEFAFEELWNIEGQCVEHEIKFIEYLKNCSKISKSDLVQPWT